MPGGRAGFFRGIDVGRIADRVFEVAWFWRLDPAAAERLPLSRFVMYEAQAARLAKLTGPDHGGQIRP
jgi:hypothetical protein